MARHVLPRTIRQSVQRQSRQLLETGSRFSRFDQLRQRHFWTHLRVSPNADGYIPSGTQSVFTTQPGQVGQGFITPLTDRDTNWKSNNRVPDNQNFEVTELGVGINVVNAAVYNNSSSGVTPIFSPDPDAIQAAFYWIRQQALMNTVLEIKYLTNAVPLGMISDFAQASGPNPGAPAIFGQGTNGFAAPALRRRFKIPILLQHGETFSFQFNTPRSWSVNLNQFPNYDVLIEEGFQIEFRLDFWATESFVEKS